MVGREELLFTTHDIPTNPGRKENQPTNQLKSKLLLVNFYFFKPQFQIKIALFS